MLRRSTLREIRRSIERYIAILAIVALGVGFFSGLKVTKSAMLETASNYLTETRFFDYQIMTSYGIDDESFKLAKENSDVAAAEASIEKDVIVGTADEGEDVKVYKAISLPRVLNLPMLKSGRMPSSGNECVVDDYASSYQIGDRVTISEINDDEAKEVFAYKEYEVVGRVSSPLYLDYERGTTTLGNGNLSSFFYIKKEGFKTDYYTSLYLRLKGSSDFFGKSADDLIDAKKKSMEKLAASINERRRENAIAKASEALADKRSEYEKSLSEYNSQRASAYSKLSSAEAELDAKSKELSNQKASLEAQLSQLEAQKEMLKNQLEMLEEQGDETELLEAQIAQLETQLTQLEAGIAQIKNGLSQIASGEKQLTSGRAELNTNRIRADKEFREARARLDDAKSQLDKAQESIDDMEAGKSYVISRNDNIGFSVFEENASIVDGIAKVFPLFFFLVAALVCMTTMTRMIDEHRTQIGILKALGYSNGAVLGKYLFYSGSAAFIGALVGFFAGCRIFPAVIWNAYGMMYDFDERIEYILNWRLFAITLAVALLCSMGATWVSCASDFTVAPAELIRPKSPRAGKRILMERIPAVWRRISFLYKVSIRNTFRYKKRFFMMVLGVSGCTALLIAGMGVNSTIKGVAEVQFDEVLNYDYLLAFKSDMSVESQRDFIEYADDVNKGKTGDILFLHEASATVKLPRESIDVMLVATDDERINDFINFHNGSEKLAYPGDGDALICEELANRHNVKIGDIIKVNDGYRSMDVRVAGVCDNYVTNYVYVNAETYREGFEKEPAVKAALVMAPDDATDDEIRECSTALRQNDQVVGASVNLDTIDMMDNMMKSLDAVVFVVILCAGLLAFIVLYNLTNINITERIREIATIKVLGFYDKETQSYVFRENYILTAIAALVGIPLGKWLLDFVISQINVNTIYFVPRITTLDYAISVILTFIFAAIVNIAMRRRLRSVSMTESLKSIE